MSKLAVLRVLPLLSATSYITFAFAEDVFIRPLVHDGSSAADIKLRRHANRILPSFNTFTARGLPFIFTTYPLSFATAAANIFLNDDTAVSFSRDAGPGPRLAALCYAAGLFFSLLHLAFGPAAMAHLDRVAADQGSEGDVKGDNTASIASWLRLNAIRATVADLPSWVCYLVAFAASA
ncbi:hypothetical protein F5Y15DRAFT_266129 [Xylariaceae sp. FL0016]|nr:hypothetical protein F5Y15DRAFT_266129 [Xylariaceae sp. FL0016]